MQTSFWRQVRISFVALLFFLLAAISASAATITVTSSADAGGTCPGANCTLRQAIATAAPNDTINFAAGITTVTLSSAELLINKNLTISGPGANLLTVQRSTAGGTPDFRVFNIAASFNVAFSGLTIANGKTSAAGGGIAIPATATLVLSNAAISGNMSTASNGGGISNLGTLTLTNSTLSGNTASAGGGGIYHNGAMATINSSTISGNTAAQGGGLFNFTTATLTNSTLSANTATQGGGVFVNNGMVQVRNTIIAQNAVTVGGSAPDYFGIFSSLGYNLIGNTSGVLAINGTTTGNQLNVNPLLGPLQNNGGSTFTHALLSNSPAIDGGHSSGSTTDQRGQTRVLDDPTINNASGGDGGDIGAYEVQADQLPGCSSVPRVVSNTNDLGAGSLRALITTVCIGTTITFAPNVTGAINLTSGELLINRNIAISGPGANLLSVQRGAGAGNFRIFNISPASVSASISGLTITNGASFSSGGGGISNSGTLTLAGITLSGNTAIDGGGVYNNFGTLTISRSTISGNALQLVISGSGGGIFNFGGTLNVVDSTISGNTAHSSSNGDSGGGILTNVGTVILTNSTIAGNTGDLGGGLRNVNGGTVRSRNTIIAGNTSANGPDVNGPLTSENFNLIGNNSAATITPAQSSDQIGTAGAPLDPMLGPLQDNGGPTFTRALLPASSAIDKGHSSGATADQRGQPRPIGTPAVNGGDGSDIGAFEVSVATPVQVVSAVSRKAHGGAGTFDIDLPLQGNPGVECRSGGVSNDYQVVVTFGSAVTFKSASVSVGTGSVGSSSGNGTATVTVNLTGVTDAQTLTIRLASVSNGSSTTDVNVEMGVLQGDVNGNRTVNATDIGQTKAVSGQALVAGNFRSDANANGSINATDIGLVKSRSGATLP